MQGRSINRCTIESTLLEVAVRTAVGWHHITPGIIELACLLLDSNGGGTASSTASQPSAVGAALMSKLFENHLAIRGEILDQVLSRAVSRGKGSASIYTRLLTELIERCPQSASALAPRIKDIISYLSYLSLDNSSRFLRALLPLIRISPSVRDTTVLVLRKALFSKEVTSRKMAVDGFVQLLGSVHEDQSPVGTDLCLELLGNLRRCLSQQTEVRRHLYRKLCGVCTLRPSLSIPCLKLLCIQFRAVLVPREDALPPIKIERITKTAGGVVYPDEPLPELIIYLARIMKIARENSPDDELLLEMMGALPKVAVALAKCDYEDYDLSKNQDMTGDSAQTAKNVTHTLALIRAHESVLEALLMFNSVDVEVANTCLKVFVKRQHLVELAKPVDKKVASASAQERLLSHNVQHQAQLLRTLLLDTRPSQSAGLSVFRCKAAFVKYVAQSTLDALTASGKDGQGPELSCLKAILCAAVTELHRGRDGSLVPKCYEDKKDKTKGLRLILIDCVTLSLDSLQKSFPEEFKDVVEGWPSSLMDEQDRLVPYCLPPCLTGILFRFFLPTAPLPERKVCPAVHRWLAVGTDTMPVLRVELAVPQRWWGGSAPRYLLQCLQDRRKGST